MVSKHIIRGVELDEFFAVLAWMVPLMIVWADSYFGLGIHPIRLFCSLISIWSALLALTYAYRCRPFRSFWWIWGPGYLFIPIMYLVVCCIPFRPL